MGTASADVSLSDTGRRSHHPIFAVFAVLLGPFIVGFHSRMFGIGLVDLRGAFGLSVDESSWINTLSTAPQILLAPCVAWLAATYGVRRVTVVPALMYAGVSLLIPFERSLNVLAMLHIIHGTLLGIFVPATLMIVFRNLPPKWWISAIAVYAFRSAFTLNSGTALLDFYVQHIGWEFLYWQDVLLAPLMAMFAILGAPHERVNQDLVCRADWGGMLLLGCGMAMLFVGIDQGNRLDWLESSFVTSCLAGGGVLLIAFLINEARVENPWAHVSAVGARNVVLLLSIACLYLFTSQSNGALIPNYLTNVVALRPEQIGATLVVWCCMPLIIMTPVTVWALHRIDGRWVLMIGLCCFALAALLGTQLTSQWSGDDFRTIAVLQGAGHILTFLPIIIMTVASGDPKQASALAAYIQVVRLLGSEVANTLMTTFLRKREQLHSFLTGLNVERGSEATTSALATLTHKFQAFGQAAAQLRGLSSLTQRVQAQANVLSYIDGFWLTFYAALLGLVLLVFVTRPAHGPLTPKDVV